jgi:hypothetical protein
MVLFLTLKEDILIHICRLTDHPKKGEANRFSLLLLPKLVKDRRLADERQKLLEGILQKCEFARDWRNRQIAHSNYSLAINPDGKAESLPGVSRQQIYTTALKGKPSKERPFRKAYVEFGDVHPVYQILELRKQGELGGGPRNSPAKPAPEVLPLI